MEDVLYTQSQTDSKLLHYFKKCLHRSIHGHLSSTAATNAQSLQILKYPLVIKPLRYQPAHGLIKGRLKAPECCTKPDSTESKLTWSCCGAHQGPGRNDEQPHEHVGDLEGKKMTNMQINPTVQAT